MQICNDADLGTEYSFPQNQNITGKAPRLLPCSSIASCPDQWSDLRTTSQTGEEKEYPDHKWYYMFLRNRELKRYIEIFTGKGGLPTGRIFFLAIRTPFKTSFMVSRGI